MAPRTTPIRTAVVGAGGIAQGRHLPALQSLGNRVEIAAVVDMDAGRAREVADQFGAPHSFGEIGEMLAQVRPDLVLVCTPPGSHTDAVIRSLDAGASVWCEKPPTLSLAEYDEILTHEGENGPYASYVFQHRFGSAAQALRRQIADGDLGAPLVGICHTLWYRDAAYYDVEWRGKWETEGGGPTMGHGIHQMDLLLSLLGDWTEVSATMGTLGRDVETEDVSFAHVTFANGAIVSVVNSVLSPRETSYLRFDFADATVEVEHLYGYNNSHWKWTPAPHANPESVAAWAPTQDLGSSHEVQLEELVSSLERGERPAASGSDGRRVLELAAGLYESAITGRRVKRGDLTRENPFYWSMNGSPHEISRTTPILKETAGA
ncbi:gfo/Idh/MocA family oxidoreductase [Arthrobacter sp. JZ12]|uniref:Gfo/Idh/MocA family protein n=1 Tax=Arthrobacter sp. JZ12 TaxID=2654190 RepID=UPI002B4AA31D|nr:Gfo/Idh/MocA family oxidoreductase [Arthrobacter sp. JZ12]WRH26141.1 gfo/Idh/MocA family oxidoreductase [Arthrobacter sp. JZ12]